MSKDLKNTIDVDVETVDNLIQSLEWIVSSINFWHIDKDYPTNLIMKVSADFMYKFRKLLANKKANDLKLKNKK